MADAVTPDARASDLAGSQWERTSATTANRHRREWTSAEDNYLRAAFRKIRINDLATYLSRTPSAVSQRALKGLSLPRVRERPAGRRWKPADEAFVRENYGRIPAEQIAFLLTRPRGSIYSKASLMNLTKAGARGLKVRWTEEDERFLLSSYGHASIDQIASRLDRSPVAVRLRAYKPRWGAKPFVRIRRSWSAVDDQILRANHGRIPAGLIARDLDRSVSSVSSRAYVLGIARHVQRSPKKDWTVDEDEFLQVKYGKIRPSEIARHLGRTRPSIYHRAEALGLTSSVGSPEFLRRQSLPRTAQPFPGFTNELDIGYVAGILDGEGSITGPPKIALQVSMTTREVTDHLHRVCGGSVSGPYHYRSGRSEICLPQYHWTMSSAENVFKILQVLLPHLIVKRKKAEIVLAFLERKWHP